MAPSHCAKIKSKSKNLQLFPVIFFYNLFSRSFNQHLRNHVGRLSDKDNPLTQISDPRRPDLEMQLFEGTPWPVYRAGTYSALILLGLFVHWF